MDGAFLFFAALEQVAFLRDVSMYLLKVEKFVIHESYGMSIEHWAMNMVWTTSIWLGLINDRNGEFHFNLLWNTSDRMIDFLRSLSHFF